MAIANPILLGDFARALKVVTITFDLPDAIENKTLGSGEIITAQHGVRLWQGTVTLAMQTWAEHEAAMALIRALQRPGAAFEMSPLHYEAIGAPNGTLNAVRNGREARFQGFTPGTVLQGGRFVSWTYDGRNAFHQLVETVTADSTGLTPYAELVPPIRPGYTLGQAVRFNAPYLKAVLVPGSVRPATIRRVVAEGVAFDWRQTLR